MCVLCQSCQSKVFDLTDGVSQYAWFPCEEAEMHSRSHNYWLKVRCDVRCHWHTQVIDTHMRLICSVNQPHNYISSLELSIQAQNSLQRQNFVHTQLNLNYIVKFLVLNWAKPAHQTYQIKTDWMVLNYRICHYHELSRIKIKVCFNTFIY